MNVCEEVLAATIAQWNAGCEAGEDTVYGRPPISMLKIATPPYYCAEVWPVCSNTHGGPVHDAEQRILNAFGEPIPRLFAAGELGGVFGHLYMSGGKPGRMLCRRLDRGTQRRAPFTMEVDARGRAAKKRLQPRGSLGRGTLIA